MKKNFVLSAVAIVMATALVFTACGGKKDGESSGSAKAAKSSDKANPATDFGYDLTADGQGILIKKYTGGPGKVVIPATIEDIPVVEIGDEAFNGETTTTNLMAAVITGNVFDAESKSTENEKAGITSITIPNSVKKIGSEAFANTAITSIVIPDSVTELGFTWLGYSNIFDGCKLLAEIRLSDNIETLPRLGDLSALKKINLPKNLKRIGSIALGDCGELSEIVIPETLTAVEFVNIKQDFFTGEISYKSEQDNAAFAGCSKLPIKTRQTIQGWGYTSSF
ncbi:hypothetical protein AGMMS49942_22310 [Spirochaetia bacterium]|nr:hypothetical protein AGMMS49942_22310 [Spirochaetia bacterium]